MSKEKLILFRKEGCPYCKRAEEVLGKNKVKYEKVEVGSDRSVVELLSGQPTVPILVKVIGSKSQDDDIIDYISKK
tara:strand:- start:1068 stop:1295 length:228 start_codon:yes stop_codon:yes gene_type:complete